MYGSNNRFLYLIFSSQMACSIAEDGNNSLKVSPRDELNLSLRIVTRFVTVVVMLLAYLYQRKYFMNK